MLIGRMSGTVVSTRLMRAGGTSVLMLKGLKSAPRPEASLYWQSHHCGQSRSCKKCSLIIVLNLFIRHCADTE